MMHAEVIDLLSGKGKFSTEEALVLAEAMGIALEKAQVVTVPILDVRFVAVDQRFTVIDQRFEVLDYRFAAIDQRFGLVNARIEGLQSTMNARFDTLEAKMEAKMQRWAVLIVISVLVGQATLGPIGASAMEGLQKALSTIVR